MTEILISLVTLIALEVILGIDNLIFISIITDKTEPEKRNKLRRLGLFLAVIIRLIMLSLLTWIMKLDNTLFTISDIAISGKGLILIAGGAFLVWKTVFELIALNNKSKQDNTDNPKASFNRLLLDILIVDFVFSVDSIITAVGIVQELWIMCVAVIVSVLMMMIASKQLTTFINKYPSYKILALTFLILIGLTLILEGLHIEIPKGYIYTSIGFSLVFNMLNEKIIKSKEI